MKRMILLLAFVLALGCLTPAFAGGICPAAGVAVDCDVLATFNPNGSVTLTYPDSVPYDSSSRAASDGDDVLVGVVNDTNTTINALVFSGSGNGGGAFMFDFDGACAYGPSCNHPALVGGYVSIYGDNGYYDQGSGVWFTGVNAAEDNGIINFAGGIAPGGSAWWSMESAVGTGPIKISATPEPVSMVLMGTFLLGSLGFLRRR